MWSLESILLSMAINTVVTYEVNSTKDNSTRKLCVNWISHKCNVYITCWSFRDILCGTNTNNKLWRAN